MTREPQARMMQLQGRQEPGGSPDPAEHGKPKQPRLLARGTPAPREPPVEQNATKVPRELTEPVLRGHPTRSPLPWEKFFRVQAGKLGSQKEEMLLPSADAKEETELDGQAPLQT
ncbi:hypothetical protein E2320_004884 [Naja naja]|nr:hypothetical protein E2320_004884 [Naja naja]